MATSNYHSVNASKIFSVSNSDLMDLQDTIEAITDDLSAHPDYTHLSKAGRYELGSYPSHTLGSIRNIVYLNNDEIEVCITAVVRSGYYEGVNFDWYLNITDDEGYEYEVANESVTDATDNLISFVEGIYSEYTQQLVQVARFSNGEVIYGLQA